MKYYFQEDETRCYLLKYHLDYMKENDIKEMVVYEAIRETEIGLFYCTFFNETGEVGEGCGKECKEYKPRNGKSGRCCYSGHFYKQGKEKTLTLKNIV